MTLDPAPSAPCDAATPAKPTGPRRAWRIPAPMLALALAAAFSFSGVFNHALWTPDEYVGAEIGREMHAGRDLLVPTLAREPFMEKPPLFWWAMTVLYDLFGVSDGVARLPSAVASFALLLLVYAFTRRVAGRRAGLFALCAQASTFGFVSVSHRCAVDSWLALFVFVALACFALAAFGHGEGEGDGEREGRRARRRCPPAALASAGYAAAGLAFLTKGPVGPALILGPLVLWRLAPWGWRRVPLARAHLVGAAILAACAALWPALLFLRGGESLMNRFIVDNVWNRVLASDDGTYGGGHRQPFWYYLADAPGKALPWLLAAPAAYVAAWRRRPPAAWNIAALRAMAVVFPLGLFLLSLPATKRGVYVAPLYAPLATIIGAWMSAAGRDAARPLLTRATLAVLMIAAVLSALALSMLLVAWRLLPLPAAVADPLARAPFQWLTISAAILAVLAVVAVVGWRWRVSRSLDTGPLAAGLILALVLCFNVAGYRILDPTKNLHPMSSDIDAMLAPDQSLIGFQLDETTRALLPFDTGRFIVAAPDAPALRARLADHPGALVIAFEKQVATLDGDLRAALAPVGTWRFEERRAYVLFRPVSSPLRDRVTAGGGEK